MARTEPLWVCVRQTSPPVGHPHWCSAFAKSFETAATIQLFTAVRLIIVARCKPLRRRLNNNSCDRHARSDRPRIADTFVASPCALAAPGTAFSHRVSSISQCGRAYRAVFASEDLSFDGETKAAATVKPSARRVLYYRNPMGLPDISKLPKKDPMGMDYIPVYEGEDEDGETVKLSAGKLQRIGVKTEAAMRRVIAEPVRAPGSMQLDERRIVVISLRADPSSRSVENVTTGSEVARANPVPFLQSGNHRRWRTISFYATRAGFGPAPVELRRAATGPYRDRAYKAGPNVHHLDRSARRNRAGTKCL